MLGEKNEKLFHCQINCFFWFRSNHQVRFGLVDMTWNDLLRTQVGVENHFWCILP